mmetsp:Transcript_43869/g.73045  ORF Transcript_43869/g.73045 Transcript_43869/m.73045 type:complete len:286 (+) Transcript_43869:207-1064(+)|eukprot:CAMPEP_0198213486 /NCGR_PEP_ID=MMETSP1445-20131203/28895_1 /TAXON_ID=36898 /ORGANISM="Pyramimonas sp., Strain CCMP2087" /LENGTH=285 /DNA_ID=CAMNT_0043888139 /DNA_START=192 /DNA_END=1049 /DNA_ORIENTATION=-
MGSKGEEGKEEKKVEEKKVKVPAADVQPQILPSDIHVLLVEDEPLSRMVVCNMLKKCRYQVTAVETGNEAWELLSAPDNPFTLLMTDVAMPGVTGLQILALVRKTPALDYLPVIMLSAHHNAGTVFETVRMGADDYILKPVAEKEIHHLWQHVYRRRLLCKSRRIRSRASEDGVCGGGGRHATLSRPPRDKAATGLVARVASLAGADELADPDADSLDPEMMSVEEMRTYCSTQIGKYQKVLYVIENFPELFPSAKKRHQGGGDKGAEFTAAVDALTSCTHQLDL